MVVDVDCRIRALRRLAVVLAVSILTVLAAVPAVHAAAVRTASLVVDFDSGAVLSEDDADLAVYPASLTKTMTLYLVFEALRDKRLTMATRLRVSERASRMPPTKLGLKPGITITVRDAVLALITKSANDAASVIAENLAGSEEKFATWMTRKAWALGMSRTVFRNASGLPNPEQRTTARDMVQLAVHLISDFPQYYGLFSTPQFVFRGRTHRNHNGVLFRYAGADGLKTGYIRDSGFNLMASAVRGDRRLVAAVFGGRSARARDNQMIALLDRGFAAGLMAQKANKPLAVAKLDDTPQVPDQRETLVASLEDGDGLIAEGDVAVARAIPKPRPKASVSKGAGKPKKQVSAAPSKPRKGYAVQVGAFKSKPQAKQAAVSAAKKAPAVLSGRTILVNPIKGRNGTLHRAWLTGLTKDQANTACRQLKKAKFACMVVQS